jgi:hypothetical protein
MLEHSFVTSAVSFTLPATPLQVPSNVTFTLVPFFVLWSFGGVAGQSVPRAIVPFSRTITSPPAPKGESCTAKRPDSHSGGFVAAAAGRSVGAKTVAASTINSSFERFDIIVVVSCRVDRAFLGQARHAHAANGGASNGIATRDSCGRMRGAS